MSNRIREFEVQLTRLNPAEAELWIRVVPERSAPDLEIRGRLIGPRCIYATTVEVAYPLRRLRPSIEAASGLVRRVVVPEPSFWEPETPFLYQGPLELWEGGRPVDRVHVSCGLRVVGQRMHRPELNGRPLFVRAVGGGRVSDATSPALRAMGVNTLILPPAEQTAAVWEMADRLGFLGIGRLPATAAAFEQARAARFHPSCLGWLLPAAVLNDERWQREARRLAAGPAGGWLGLEADDLAGTPPAEVHFLLCRQGQESALRPVGLPMIVRTERPEVPAGDDIVGILWDPPAPASLLQADTLRQSTLR